jgi:hypothetical protein
VVETRSEGRGARSEKQPVGAQRRCALTIPAGYSARAWNLLRQPRHVAAGRVENPPLPGSHHSPFAIRYSPFAIRRSIHSPFAVFIRCSPLAARRSPLAARRLFHSPFAIRRSSPLATRYSPLATRDSPSFTIRHSPLAARRLSARRLYTGLGCLCPVGLIEAGKIPQRSWVAPSCGT